MAKELISSLRLRDVVSLFYYSHIFVRGIELVVLVSLHFLLVIFLYLRLTWSEMLLSLTMKLLHLLILIHGLVPLLRLMDLLGLLVIIFSMRHTRILGIIIISIACLRLEWTDLCWHLHCLPNVLVVSAMLTLHALADLKDRIPVWRVPILIVMVIWMLVHIYLPFYMLIIL